MNEESCSVTHNPEAVMVYLSEIKNNYMPSFLINFFAFKYEYKCTG